MESSTRDSHAHAGNVAMTEAMFDRFNAWVVSCWSCGVI